MKVKRTVDGLVCYQTRKFKVYEKSFLERKMFLQRKVAPVETCIECWLKQHFSGSLRTPRKSC